MTTYLKFIPAICIFTFLICIQISARAQNNQHHEALPDVIIGKNVAINLERSIAINNEHPYIDFFEKQDRTYIRNLYGINKGRSINKADYHQTSKVIKGINGNAPLVFTVIKDNQLKYDTLRNTLHPSENIEEKEGWDFLGLRKWWSSKRALDVLEDQNLKGDLPKGCMTYVSNSSKGFECGVQVIAPRSLVKIEIENLDGLLIATLEDGYLLKGWSNYKWKKGNRKKKHYVLKVTVDGQTMSQNIKVK